MAIVVTREVLWTGEAGSARDVKSGVKQLVHFVCLSVCKRHFMIEELLKLEHESEHEPAVYQYFSSEFGKLYGISFRSCMCRVINFFRLFACLAVKQD